MTTQEIDDKIAPINVQLLILQERLEDLSQEYVQAVKVFFAQWTVPVVREAVVTQPDLMEEFSPQSIAALKRGAEALAGTIGARVEGEFNADYVWPHRTGLTKRIDVDLSSTLFLRITREVGALLIRHRVIRQEEPSAPIIAPEGWQATCEMDRVVSSAEYALAIPDDIAEIEKLYWNEYQDLATLGGEIKALEEQKRDIRIQALWDNA